MLDASSSQSLASTTGHWTPSRKSIAHLLAYGVGQETVKSRCRTVSRQKSSSVWVATRAEENKDLLFFSAQGRRLGKVNSRGYFRM